MSLASILYSAVTQSYRQCALTNKGVISLSANPFDGLQQVRFAKRRGLRLKKELDKKKLRKAAGPTKEEEKKFIPYKLIKAQREGRQETRRYDFEYWSNQPKPVDDVYPMQFYKIPQYTTSEAIDLIRETHHPTVYNLPDSLIHTIVELDMRAAKKNKFIDRVSGILNLPCIYEDAPKNNIIAITKDEDEQVEVLNRGAIMAGHKQIIQELKTGLITNEDFDYILVNQSIIQDMVPLRGLLRHKYPTFKNKMATFTLADDVDKFRNGIGFEAVKDPFEHDFGSIDIICGQLTMTNEQIVSNLQVILQTINEFKPNSTTWPFITRIMINSPPSKEKYDILVEEYSGEAKSSEQTEEKIKSN